MNDFALLRALLQWRVSDDNHKRALPLVALRPVCRAWRNYLNANFVKAVGLLHIKDAFFWFHGCNAEDEDDQRHEQAHERFPELQSVTLLARDEEELYLLDGVSWSLAQITCLGLGHQGDWEMPDNVLIETLDHFHKLERLAVWGAWLSATPPDYLTSLRTLSVFDNTCGGTALWAPGSLPEWRSSLTHLFYQASFSQEEMAGLQDLSALQKLQLHLPRQLESGEERPLVDIPLTGLTALTHLELQGVGELRSVLQQLPALPNLVDLDLTDVSPSDFERCLITGDLPRLQTIKLHSRNPDNWLSIDVVIQAHLPCLQELDLGHDVGSADICTPLPRCTQLQIQSVTAALPPELPSLSSLHVGRAVLSALPLAYSLTKLCVCPQTLKFASSLPPLLRELTVGEGVLDMRRLCAMCTATPQLQVLNLAYNILNWGGDAAEQQQQQQQTHGHADPNPKRSTCTFPAVLTLRLHGCCADLSNPHEPRIHLSHIPPETTKLVLSHKKRCIVWQPNYLSGITKLSLRLIDDATYLASLLDLASSMPRLCSLSLEYLPVFSLPNSLPALTRLKLVSIHLELVDSLLCAPQLRVLKLVRCSKLQHVGECSSTLREVFVDSCRELTAIVPLSAGRVPWWSVENSNKLALPSWDSFMARGGNAAE